MSFMQIRPSVRIQIPKQNKQKNAHRKIKEINSLSHEKLLHRGLQMSIHSKMRKKEQW